MSSATVGRPCGSRIVVTTPRGLCSRRYVGCVGGASATPLTSTRSPSSTSVPNLVTTRPLTCTDPAAINSSACLREATPAFAKYLLSRTPSNTTSRKYARRAGYMLLRGLRHERHSQDVINFLNRWRECGVAGARRTRATSDPQRHVARSSKPSTFRYHPHRSRATSRALPWSPTARTLRWCASAPFCRG